MQRPCGERKHDENKGQKNASVARQRAEEVEQEMRWEAEGGKSECLLNAYYVPDAILSA